MTKTVTVTLTWAQVVWLQTLVANAATLHLSSRGAALNAAAYRALLRATEEST